VARGWCNFKGVNVEDYYIQHRSLQLQTRDSEAPTYEPVPLHRASRHVGTGRHPGTHSRSVRGLDGSRCADISAYEHPVSRVMFVWTTSLSTLRLASTLFSHS
jgi:hypothetical protein